MRKQIVLLSALCLTASSSCFADFQYQNKTQITGGSAVAAMKLAGAFSKQARRATDPIVSSVFVKGNRMANINPTNTEIIDLDKGTITQIDHTKMQYTVMTFEQLKQQMEQAAEKMKEEQAKEKAKPPAAAPADPDTKMSFDVKVHETGATKDVDGLSAKEAILNMNLTGTNTKTNESGALAIANDMWLVSEVPGYGELRDFEKRYAAKMGMMLNDSFGRTLRSMQPGMAQGTAEMAKEMAKLKGTPVLQVMRVGSTVNGQPLPAASEAPLPPSADPAVSMPNGNDIAKSAGTAAATSAIESRMKGFGGLASSIGSLHGFGKKKKADAQTPPPADATGQTPPAAGAADQPTYAVLMETTSEMSGFSSAAVDPAKFQVPQGYKEVPFQEKQ